MIDWSQVKALRDQIGADEMDEVIELFIEEVEDTVNKLRGPADLEGLEDSLHFLKGGALNLGFSALSSLCQTGETLANQGNADQVDVPEIITCYEASKTVFMAEIDDNLAA